MSEFLRVVESPLIEAFGWALVHFLWQGTLLAGLMAALLIPLRKTSSHVKYVFQCTVLSVMAACPLVTWWFGSTTEENIATVSSLVDTEILIGLQIAAERPETNEAMSAGSMVPDDLRDRSGRSILRSPSEDAAAVTRPDLVHSDEPTEASIPWNERFHRKLRPAIPWMVGVWLLGVVLLSVRLLVGWRVVQRLRRLAVTPAAEAWQTCLKDVAARMQISRPVRLMESVLIEIPTVIGWLRPVILIPASILMNLTPRQLEAVLSHELAHIRRHDYLVNLIQSAIETLLFYHPAVWWLSRLIRNEREHCCDDLALSLCDDRVTYVSALAALEELRSSPSLTVAANGGSLLDRVRRIAGVGPNQRPLRLIDRWPVAFLSFMTLGCVLIVSMNWSEAAKDEPTNATAVQENVGPKSEPKPQPDVDELRFLDELRLELKRDAAHGGNWFFVDLDRGLLATPPFPVEIDTERLPYFVIQPKTEELNAWLVREGIDLILFSNDKPLGGGSGRMNQEIQTRSVRTNLKSVANGLQPRPDGSWTLKTQPSEVVALFARKDETTHVSGFVPNSSSGELRTDSPNLSAFRTAENVLGLYLLEQRNALKDELTLRIVRVANATTPLADVQFGDGDFVTGSNGPADPTQTTQPIMATLPHGVRVEFVGLAPMEAEPKTWWTPNGGPLDEVPLHDNVAPKPALPTERRGVIRVDGVSGSQDVIANYDGVRMDFARAEKEGALFCDVRLFEVDTLKTGRVEIGVATEPLSAVRVLDSSGVKVPRTADEPADHIAEDIDVGIVTGEKSTNPKTADDARKRTLISFDAPVPGNRQIDLDLKLIDIDGIAHEKVSMYGGGLNAPRRKSTYRFDVPPERVARFEYRMRLYRHWVTFDNVSMNPSEPTDVKVSVNSLPPEMIEAKLPNGVKVELVGVSTPPIELPSKDKRTWWKGDGSPLDQSPFPLGFLTVGPDKADGREFAIRVAAPGEKPSLMMLFPAGGQWSNSRIQWTDTTPERNVAEWQEVLGPVGEATTTTLRIGVASDPWTIIRFDPEGKPNDDPPLDDALKILRDSIKGVRAGPFEDGVALWTQPVSSNSEHGVIELVALDKSGKPHFPNGGSSDGKEQCFPFNIPPDELDHFEFRLRPFRHWVTFTGVSLAPGQESDVKVTTGLPQPTDAQLIEDVFQPLECTFVDAVTGMPITEYPPLKSSVLSFHKPLKKAAPGDRFTMPSFVPNVYGIRRPGKVTITIPNVMMSRADRDEWLLKMNLGYFSPIFWNYEPPDPIPLKQLLSDDPKSGRESFRTIKLTPKKKAEPQTGQSAEWTEKEEFHGTVRDRRQNPVAGATVALSVVTGDGCENQERTIATTATDEAGKFRLSVLSSQLLREANSRTNLWVWTSDVATDGFGVGPIQSELEQPVEMVLFKPMAEDVELVDVNGDPVRGTVERLNLSMGVDLILPKELFRRILPQPKVNGAFRLIGFPLDRDEDQDEDDDSPKKGEWRSLRIKTADRGRQILMWHPTLRKDVPTQLLLQEPALIQGRLTAASGTLPADLLEQAEIVLLSSDRDPGESNLFRTGIARVRCDSEGRFEVRDLSAGKLGAITLHLGDVTGWTWQIPRGSDGEALELPSGEVTNIEVPLIRTRSVRGKLVGPSVEPLPNIELAVSYGPHRRSVRPDKGVETSSDHLTVIRTDETGAFSVEVVPGSIFISKSAAPGLNLSTPLRWPSSLAIARPDGGLQVDPNETPLMLPPVQLTVLTGRVIDHEERPYQGLILASSAESGETVGLNYSQQDGSFHLETTTGPDQFTVLSVEDSESIPFKEPITETIVVSRNPLVLQVKPKPATRASLPDDVEFLSPYPKLHGLSLDMTEPQFLEIVKQQDVKTDRTVDGEKVTHHIGLDDGHTLIVMFDTDGNCSGIQRVRGENSQAGRILEFRFAAQPADSNIDPRVPADYLQRHYPDYPPAGREGAMDSGFVWIRLANPKDSKVSLPLEGVRGNDVRVALLADTAEHALLANGKWSVEEARVVADPNGNDRFAIELKLNEAGGAAMRVLTKAHLNQPLAIVVNGEIISAPIVRDEIGQNIALTGNFKREQAEHLAAALSMPPQAAAGNEKIALRGRILFIDQNRQVATISLGTDNSVRKDMKFEVRTKKDEIDQDRAPIVKGTVEVIRVEQDHSEVRILTEDAAHRIAQDDDVVPVADDAAGVDPQPQVIDPNGEIFGRLIDAATGNPVEGAMIACGAVINDSLKGGGTNAITDAEGRYRLPVPSPGIYNVWLKKFDQDRTMTAAADDGLLVEANKVTKSELWLVKGRKVAGFVVDAGKPLANMTVSCNSAARPQSGGIESIKTKDDGAFEFALPPGRARVCVIEPNGEPFGIARYAEAHLTVSAAEEVVPIALAMKNHESKFGDPNWLKRSTPGTEIISHVDAAAVTGTVVDVAGQPITGAKVFREDGLINLSNDKGEFKVSIDNGTQFVMYAFAPGYHVWFGTPAAGDVLKIVLEKKVLQMHAFAPGYRAGFGTPTAGDEQKIVMEKKSKDSQAAVGSHARPTDRQRTVEVCILGGEKQSPLADVEVVLTSGNSDQQKKIGPFTTDATGTIRANLTPDDRSGYRVQLNSEKELPYLPVDETWNKASRGPTPSLHFTLTDRGITKWIYPEKHVQVAKIDEAQRVTFTLLPACELTLRAVDAGTGQGLPGVEFYEENAVGEDWAHAIHGQNIGWKPVADTANVTDNDGNFSRLVSANAGFKYGVQKSPAGYEVVDGREVEIDIRYGQLRPEHVFKFRRIQQAVRAEPK